MDGNSEEKPQQKENKSDASKAEKEEAEEKTEKEKGTKTEAEELTKEEKMAAEQWLRRIPDDPGGLLRRKFIQQYQQRNRSKDDSKQPW